MNTIYTRASNHGDDIAGLMLVVLGDTDVSRITSDTDPPRKLARRRTRPCDVEIDN